MKKHLLKLAGMSALVLLIHSSGYAQDETYAEGKDTSIRRHDGEEEIIIRQKTGKDAKVTIEIKDGQVLINGKPANEYQDGSLSIHKRKLRTGESRGYEFMEPMPPMPPLDPMEPGAAGPKIMMSPFRSHGGVQNYAVREPNRAFLGVSSERQKEGQDGAMIREITPGSGAEKAGLKAGDLITRINDLPIDGPKELTEAVRKYKPQEKITITYKRAGKEQKVTAVLGKSESFRSYNYQYDMAPDLRLPPGFNGFWNDDEPKLGIGAQDTEDGKGVKILSVTDESAAGKAGIKEGDIITKYDGKEVTSAPQLAELVRDSKSRSSVQVNLLRDGKSMDLEVKMPKKLKTADM
jgi:serine protease Do